MSSSQRELREVEKLLKLDPTNTELLAQKQKLLADSVEAAREKLEKLRIAQEQAQAKVASGEIGEDQYRALEREVIKAEQSLQKLEVQADNTGGEMKDAGKAAAEAGEDAAESGDKWGGLGEKMLAIGAATAAIAAVGAAVKKVVAEIADLAKKAAYAADDLNTMAAVTGLSTKQLQIFLYASEQIDVSFETLSGSMTRLVRNMGTAQRGTGDAAIAFEQLGIAITDDVTGELRDSQEVFDEIIEALGEMENETQRDAYAMQILGKSARDLNPLIQGGADALKEYGEQAEAAGLILEQGALDKLNLVSDALDTFKATASSVGNLLMVQFAQPIASAIDWVTERIHNFTTEMTSGPGAAAKQLGASIKEAAKETKAADAAFESTTEKLAAQTAITESYIGKLRELEAQGLSTEAASRQYAAVVENLNALYPDLNAQIDENTGLLQNGIGALEEYTQAWLDAAVAQAAQEHLAEILGTTAGLMKDLALKEGELHRKIAEKEALSGPYYELIDALGLSREHIDDVGMSMLELSNMGANSADESVRSLAMSVFKASGEYDNLTDGIASLEYQIEKGNKAVEESKEKYDLAEESLSEYINSLINADEAGGEGTETTINHTEAIEKLAKATNSLAGESDRLTKALKEQEGAGTLSLGTINSLIDSGYALALQIDAETGAVTVNKDAYIALAAAKIEEQIKSAEIDRAMLRAELISEATAAIDTADSYYAMAAAKAAADAALAGSAEYRTYSAQIAALKELKASLGSVSSGYASVGGAAKKAAKEEESAAKQALRAYQDKKKDLDHLKAMDVLDEAKYYDALSKLREEYLTDDENLEEYRKVTEQIHAYDQKMLDASLASYEGHLDEVSDVFKAALSELESEMSDLQRRQESFAGRLASYSDIFDKDESGKITASDPKEALATLEKYRETIAALKDAGLSEGLLAEVTSKDVTSAIAYGEDLLSKSKEDFEEYVDVWEQTQALAKEIAAEYYKDQLTTLETEYNDKLGEALTSLQETAYSSGEETVHELIAGALEQKDALVDTYEQMAKEAIAAFRSAFEDSEVALNYALTTDSLPGKSLYSAGGQAPGYTDAQAAEIVSSIKAAFSDMSITVAPHDTVVNIDGIEAARAIDQPLYDLRAASPQIKDDF